MTALEIPHADAVTTTAPARSLKVVPAPGVSKFKPDHLSRAMESLGQLETTPAELSGPAVFLGQAGLQAIDRALEHTRIEAGQALVAAWDIANRRLQRGEPCDYVHRHVRGGWGVVLTVTLDARWADRRFREHEANPRASVVAQWIDERWASGDPSGEVTVSWDSVRAASAWLYRTGARIPAWS